MPVETSTPAPEEKPLTAAEQRARAVRAYLHADSKEAKAALIAKYPFLKEVFAAGNHS